MSCRAADEGGRGLEARFGNLEVEGMTNTGPKRYSSCHLLVVLGWGRSRMMIYL